MSLSGRDEIRHVTRQGPLSMTELAAPTAKRLQRPSWRDGRLLVGVVLVLLAATLGARVVASADERLAYFVAAEDLVAGQPVSASSFKRVDVALADAMSRYLQADAPVPTGRVLVRDVRAGELVPAAALGAEAEVSVQPVTVRADSVSTAGLASGQRVDVYVTPKESTTSPSPGDAAAARTTRLLSGVAVVAVLTSDGGFGTAATTSVQLYVPRTDVQGVIAAVDSEAKVTLVPVLGASTGSPRA